MDEGDVAWLECRLCGGVYAIFRHPHDLPVPYSLIQASLFIGMDGEPVTRDDLRHCMTCGKAEGAHLEQFYVRYVRRGARLPLPPEEGQP